MTYNEAIAILDRTDYSATPAQYSAAWAIASGDSINGVDPATYAAGYAAAHPNAPAGTSNTWLWIGGAIGVWWFFFRRRR